MGFSAICSSHKYLLIRDISGKSEVTCSSPLKECLAFHLDTVHVVEYPKVPKYRETQK